MFGLTSLKLFNHVTLLHAVLVSVRYKKETVKSCSVTLMSWKRESVAAYPLLTCGMAESENISMLYVLRVELHIFFLGHKRNWTRVGSGVIALQDWHPQSVYSPPALAPWSLFFPRRF